MPTPYEPTGATRVAVAFAAWRMLRPAGLLVLVCGCCCGQGGPGQRSISALPAGQVRQTPWPVPGLEFGTAWLPQPSNDRNWTPDQAVLAHAEVERDVVRMHNVRNIDYRTADDYTVRYEDRTYHLKDLDSVDFLMVPFSGMPGGAHTFLSFGFGGTDYLAVSVEIRKERGEEYAPIKGLLRQFEIMYVVGDERDLIGLRANHRLDDVYLYRVRAPREKIQELFLDVVERINSLVEGPEFYNTITNNCTTNIMRHVNRIAPDRIPYGFEVLLPGFSDRLAYDLGLLEAQGPFEQARRRARINRLAYEYRDAPDFSVRIRQAQGQSP